MVFDVKVVMRTKEPWSLVVELHSVWNSDHFAPENAELMLLDWERSDTKHSKAERDKFGKKYHRTVNRSQDRAWKTSEIKQWLDDMKIPHYARYVTSENMELAFHELSHVMMFKLRFAGEP